MPIIPKPALKLYVNIDAITSPIIDIIIPKIDPYMNNFTKPILAGHLENTKYNPIKNNNSIYRV